MCDGGKKGSKLIELLLLRPNSRLLVFELGLQFLKARSAVRWWYRRKIFDDRKDDGPGDHGRGRSTFVGMGGESRRLGFHSRRGRRGLRRHRCGLVVDGIFFG